MREHARIERILSKLSALWNLSTDQRLGQLVMNILHDWRGTSKDEGGHFLWNLEDDQWELALDRMIARYREEVTPTNAPLIEEILRTVNQSLNTRIEGDTITITDITIHGQDPGDEG